MSLLHRLRSGTGTLGASYAPWDNFWYRPPGYQYASGVTISPDTVETLSTMFAGLNMLSQDIASLPLLFYRRLERGKERAIEHPLYWILGWQPNVWQTSMEYIEMLVSHVALRGDFFAQIITDPRGNIQQLVPRHPDRVTVEVLPSGAPRYVWRPNNGQPVTFTQDEMHHVRGRSKDGYRGMSLIEYGVRVFGSAMASDTFAENFFKQGAVPSIVVRHPGPAPLGPEGQENLRNSIQSFTGGLHNAHRVMVLEEGMEASALGISPREAQALDSRQFSIEEMARLLNMPLHKLKVNKPGAVSYASTEMFDLEYVMDSLRPWCVRIEKAVWRDCLGVREKGIYVPEFLLEARLRGDSASRARFYESGIKNRWLFPNEARERENLNPYDGGDEFPEVTAGAGTTRTSEDDPRDPRGRPVGEAYSRARLIVMEAAARVVQKEIAAATKAAQRCANDAGAWQTWCREFYDDHAGFIEHVLKLPSHEARQYAATQGHALATQGIGVMRDWDARVVPQLAAIALGGTEEAA